MKNINFRSGQNWADMYNYNKMFRSFIIPAIIFFLFINVADAQTQQKLQNFYNWLKPIVNVILACVTLFAMGKAVMKTFMKHQEAGMEWTMFIVALVLWGLWAAFAGEIINLFGGTSPTF